MDFGVRMDFLWLILVSVDCFWEKFVNGKGARYDAKGGMLFSYKPKDLTECVPELVNTA